MTRRTLLTRSIQSMIRLMDGRQPCGFVWWQLVELKQHGVSLAHPVLSVEVQTRRADLVGGAQTAATLSVAPSAARAEERRRFSRTG